jgi:thioredoxin 1
MICGAVSTVTISTSSIQEAEMTSRRSFLFLVGLVGLAPAALAVPARAFEFQPYVAAAAQKAIASGKPVVVHVYAPWCLQCHAQASILDSLKKDPSFDGVTFFRVDYDNQKDVVAKLNCPRSTLIAYKGGKEVARMSWETTRDSVLNVLKAAM